MFPHGVVRFQINETHLFAKLDWLNKFVHFSPTCMYDTCENYWQLHVH
jgi:hypothetical protein